MNFNRDIVEALKFYVYLLSDPRTGDIFYVGKGKGNRIFQHFKDKDVSDKTRKINELQSHGLIPKIEILVHGIHDEITVKKKLRPL